MVNWNELKPEDKMSRARVKIQRKYPFYGHIVLHLTMVETDDLPTAGVDFKGNLFYNPEFIDGLDKEEARGLILHEALHLVLEGRMRQKGRQNHQLWNIAQDAIINHTIVQENQKEFEGVNDDNIELNLPETIPGDVTGKEEDGEPVMPNEDGSIEIGGANIEDLGDETFESVYDILKREADENKIEVVVVDEHIQGEEGEGGGGEGEESEEGEGKKVTVTNGEGEEIEVEIEAGEGQEISDTEVDTEEVLEEAAQRAVQERGEVPASVEQRVEEVQQSDQNWKKVLHSIIGNTIPHDYSYQSPHKKSHSLGVYFPHTRGEKVEVTVALDTSGSISDKNLSEFLGEVIDIVQQYSVVDLRVIQHDADVHAVDEWDRASKDDIIGEDGFIIEGRGGTDHHPVFEELEEQESNNDIVIMFTDGYTSVPDEKPLGVGHVVWAINNYDVGMDRLKFGDILRVHAEE